VIDHLALGFRCLFLSFLSLSLSLVVGSLSAWIRRRLNWLWLPDGLASADHLAYSAFGLVGTLGSYLELVGRKWNVMPNSDFYRV